MSEATQAIVDRILAKHGGKRSGMRKLGDLWDRGLLISAVKAYATIKNLDYETAHSRIKTVKEKEVPLWVSE